MEIDSVLNRLVERLKEADPYKIVLFGSHAKGTAVRGSDIDLMVILDNYDIAKTYKERLNKRCYVRKLLRDINYRYAMDILVYSRAEFQKRKSDGSYLIDEVEKTGRTLYEKYN
ncbi:MAG: nucleotidyltransferase domain-containing protein [Endomicrobia bacterium]|nr:nucleotidyltransferase domain-containing protein [Endomicrobiia bacterium]